MAIKPVSVLSMIFLLNVDSLGFACSKEVLTRKLFNAVAEGVPESLNECIENGADLKAKDENLATVLHHAALGNHVACLALLLATKKVDLNSLDGHGKTPVHVAAYVGNIESLRMLLNAGAVVDVLGQDNMTPLHIAVLRGEVESVRTLTRYGANVKTGTQSDATALHFAAVGGEKHFNDSENSFHPLIPIEKPFSSEANKEITKILLAHGADYQAPQNSGITPYALAKIYNNVGVLEIFELTCAYCQKKAVIYRCSQCKQNTYCSPSCQKHDWVEHKSVCKKLL